MYKKILTAFLLMFFAVAGASAQTTKPFESIPIFKISDSAAYMGKYRYENLPFEHMIVSVKDNQLYYEGGTYSGTLAPKKDKYVFEGAGGEALFTFLRNNEGKITDLQIDYAGQTFVGKRE